jgi:hypothetical protein
MQKGPVTADLHGVSTSGRHSGVSLSISLMRVSWPGLACHYKTYKEAQNDRLTRAGYIPQIKDDHV